MVVAKRNRISAQPKRALPYSGDWVDQSWHTEANCAGADVDMISPEKPGTLIYQYCTSCPVALDCAEAGLAIEATYGDQVTGIWGGVYIPANNDKRKKGVQALSEVCASLRITHGSGVSK